LLERIRGQKMKWDKPFFPKGANLIKEHIDNKVQIFVIIHEFLQVYQKPVPF
jgi:hypothetical protein